MTLRGAILSVGALLWLGALICWLRGRESRRLSREGILFLILGTPFLVAGAFFTDSSYRGEVLPEPIIPSVTMMTPLPSLTPSTPAPRAAPPDREPRTYQEAVLAAQRTAVQKYPELQRAGSPFNSRFVAAYRRLRFEDPNFFVDPEWPLHLADRLAQAPIGTPP